MRNVILFSLMFFLFAACTEQLVNTDDSSLSEVQLKKKPVKPPPPPPPTPIPALNPGTKYIAGTTEEGIVFIWERIGDNFSRLWSSSIEADRIGSIAIGDFNGGSKELFVERSITRGKVKKNRIRSQELLIFTEGDIEPSEIIVLREPAEYPDALWDMKVADVDGDSKLELVLVFRDQLEIWEYDETGFFKADFCYYFSTSEIPWEASIGDLYNNGVIDISVAVAQNMWRSYTYDGYSISTGIESSSYSNEFGSLCCAKMVDINNDGNVEVIGGSSCGKLLLWKDPYINPMDIVVSPSLGLPEYTSPWGVDVGNLGGVPANGMEIICGVPQSGGLHLFHYDGKDFSYGGEVVHELSVSMNGVIISGSGVGAKIIVATDNGLEVFNNTYSSIYNDNVGKFFENLIYQ